MRQDESVLIVNCSYAVYLRIIYGFKSPEMLNFRAFLPF